MGVIEVLIYSRNRIWAVFIQVNCEQVYCLVFLLKAKEALDKIKLPIISYGLYTTNNKIMLWLTQKKDTTVIMQNMKKQK